MPRVTKNSQKQIPYNEVIVQEFLQVDYAGRSYITIKPDTYEDLRKGVIRLLKIAAFSHRDLQLSTHLPSFGDTILEIDPAAWPALRDHITVVTARLIPPIHSCSSPGGMRIFIVTPSGERFSIPVESSDTIDDVKETFHDRTGTYPDQHRLFYEGKQLEDGRTLSDYNIQRNACLDSVPRLVGGKPVIYLFTPTPVDASVSLSLTRNWSFSAIYPAPISSKGDSIVWNVHARPDGILRCRNTETDVSYLYWEAESNPVALDIDTPPSSPRIPSLAFDPAAPIVNSTNSVLLTINEVPKYLDRTLLQLGLHVEARTSFITYWLPSLLKHAHIALRFLPQEEYEEAAPMAVSPTPALVTRVFMLFKGVPEASRDDWARVSAFDWGEVVGVKDMTAVCSGEGLRVLEWGGMEVLV